PINQFAHGRFPAAPFEKDDGHPHADCLRSSAWLDLRYGPIVCTVPPTDRYHLLSLWSGWYEIFDTIGTRQTGFGGGHYAIAGPRWSDSLPDNVRPIAAPTDIVWIEGYFEVGAADDIGPAHRVQDQFRLTPLSDWKSPRSAETVPFPLVVYQSMTP